MISDVVMVDSAVTVRLAFAAAPVVADTIVIEEPCAANRRDH